MFQHTTTYQALPDMLFCLGKDDPSFLNKRSLYPPKGQDFNQKGIIDESS